MSDERRHAISRQTGEGGLPENVELERTRTEPDDEEIAYRFLAAVPQRAGVVEAAPTDNKGQTFFDFASDLAESEEDEEITPVGPSETSQVTRLLAEQKRAQRRKGGMLSSLVNELFRCHNIPYAKIHAQLNSLQKVTGQSRCTLEQLAEREELLRQWLRSGEPPRRLLPKGH